MAQFFSLHYPNSWNCSFSHLSFILWWCCYRMKKMSSSRKGPYRADIHKVVHRLDASLFSHPKMSGNEPKICYKCHIKRKRKLLRHFQYTDMSGTRLSWKLVASTAHLQSRSRCSVPHLCICQCQYDYFQDQLCLVDYIWFRWFPWLFSYMSDFGLINSVLFY